MSAENRCQRCGGAWNAAAGPCPRCLFGFAFAEVAPASSSAHTSSSAAPAEPPELEDVARALPQFERFETLGRGGMGAVFKAWERSLQRFVAIKVLPRGLAERADFRERFLREARALARLTHPNIVAVHGSGESDGLCYLVMELVDGRNLREVMRERRVETGEALRIVRALCEALQYAHDEGVVHRDVKPENVLIDASGRVRIADFGLAKIVALDGEELGHLTRVDQVMGTPHYMAPEQLERPHDVDHRADLFAVGVVLYEMLTGSLPRGTFELPSRRVAVDIRIDDIVLKALEREPSRRYQHALEVKGDVERLDRAAQAPHESPRLARKPARTPSVLARDPLRSGRAFAFFVGLWIFCGATWNLGPFAFGLGCVGVASAVLFMARLRMSATPELALAVAALSNNERMQRVVLAPGLTLLGLGLAALAHVGVWERGATLWVPAFRGLNGLSEHWQLDPWSLARVCAVEPSALGEFLTYRTLASFTSTTVGNGATWSPWWLMLAAAVILVLAVRCAVDPGRAREQRRAAWTVTASLGTELCAALVVLWVAAPLLSSRGDVTLSGVQRSFSAPAGSMQVALRVRDAIQRAGLKVDVDQSVELVDRRSAQRVVSANLLRCADESPFERWTTSWRGAVRTTPQVWVTVARAEGGEQTFVQLSAGLYPLEAPEREAVEKLFDEIEVLVRKP